MFFEDFTCKQSKTCMISKMELVQLEIGKSYHNSFPSIYSPLYVNPVFCDIFTSSLKSTRQKAHTSKANIYEFSMKVLPKFLDTLS